MPSGVYIRTEKHRRILSVANKNKKHAPYIRTEEHKKKISISMQNKFSDIERSQKTREIIRQQKLGVPRYNIRGEKHPNWKGGNPDKDLAVRQSPEYREWRNAVFKRDNYTCVFCGDKSVKGNKVTLHADHIKPFSLYHELRLEVDNGRTLCAPCHRKTETYGFRQKKLST